MNQTFKMIFEEGAAIITWFSYHQHTHGELKYVTIVTGICLTFG